MTRVGSFKSSRNAPRQYFRIAPTPWLNTSQPASVSIGEPQLPSLMNSHGCAGDSNTFGVGPEMDVVGEHDQNVLVVLAREHDVLPLTLRGNSAMPLFCTAGPLSVLNLKCTKSGVSSNCGSVILPS
jgi:hypothetical protein